MRWIKYQFLRLCVRMVREKAPPEYVAKGWALGMFIGCAVPFGLQLIISIPLSFKMKCSKIGATFGTLITNPVTIFFIYPAQTWAANRLLGGKLGYDALEKMLDGVTFEKLRSLGVEIFASFLIGGILLALVFAPLTYYVVLHWVRQYRRIKDARRKRKEARLQYTPS